MSSVEDRYREVNAALFWGSKNSMDQVSSAEENKVKDFINNGPRYADSAESILGKIKSIFDNKEKLNSNQKQVFKKAVDGLKRNLSRTVNVFQNHGLWDSYDGARYRQTHDKFKGLAKLAAVSFGQGSIGRDLMTFLAKVPKVLKEAEKDLEQEKDKSYLNGLYRLVHDTLMDEDGVLTLLQELEDEFGDLGEDLEKVEEDNEKGLDVESKKKRINWIGTKGIEQISDAINSVIDKKRPKKEGPLQGKFDQVVENSTKKLVAEDWSNRLKSALGKFGFNTDGSFDKDAFESRTRKMDELVRTAEDSSVGSIPALKKEFMGTYEAFNRAMDEYKGSSEKQRQVVDTYFELILDGKDNLYKSLKDLHGSISDSTKNLPDQPKVEEPKEVKENNPEEDTKKDVEEVKEEPGKGEKGEEVKEDPKKEETPEGVVPEGKGKEWDYSTSKNPGHLPTLIREFGNYPEAFMAYAASSSYSNGIFSAYTETARKRTGIKVEELDKLLKSVIGLLSKYFNFTEGEINRRPVMEVMVKSPNSPHRKFMNRLEALLSTVGKDNIDPQAIASELRPIVSGLKDWVHEVYEKGGQLPDEKEEKEEKEEKSTKEKKVDVEPSNVKEVLEEAVQESSQEETITEELDQKAEGIGKVVQENPEVLNDEVETGDEEATEDVSAIIDRINEYLSRTEDVDEAVSFSKKMLIRATKKAREEIKNPNLSEDVRQQLAGALKVLDTEKESLGSVEDLEKVIGKVESNVDARSSEVSSLLDELRSAGRALRSVGTNDSISKLRGLLKDTKDISEQTFKSLDSLGKTPKVKEDKEIPKEPEESKEPEELKEEERPEKDKLPPKKEEDNSEKDTPEEEPNSAPEKDPEDDDISRSGEDLARSLHASLIKKLPNLYSDIAEELASHLIYGKKTYFGPGVLSSLGLESQAKGLLRSAEALGVSAKAANKSSFLKSVDAFVDALGSYLEESGDEGLIDSFDEVSEEIRDIKEELKPVSVAKTASSRQKSYKVLQAFFEKQANTFNVEIPGIGSREVEGRDPKSIRGALGRILSKDFTGPTLGAKVNEYYTHGAYKVKPAAVSTPPRQSFSDFHKPSKDTPQKGDPNQTSLF